MLIQVKIMCNHVFSSSYLVYLITLSVHKVQNIFYYMLNKFIRELFYT